MRVAAIYDVHGNLPALEAVLDDVARAGVDLIVVGGDVVSGPMPRESLARLLELDAPIRFIRGNADREVAALRAAGEAGVTPEEPSSITQRWVARQLEPGHARVLAGWPETLHLEIEGLEKVLFCHATPRSDRAVFTRLTPEERTVAGVRRSRRGAGGVSGTPTCSPTGGWVA